MCSVKHITASIAAWIVRDCRPISVTEDHGFRNMLRVATGCSQYTPSCYATITHIIQSHYDTEKRNVQTELYYISADGVALTVDFWTSIQNISHIGVTAYYVNNNWKLQRKELDVVIIAEHVW